MSPWRRTAIGGPHRAYTSRSLIPGAMVPVSGESKGTSRRGRACAAGGAAGAEGAGGAGGAETPGGVGDGGVAGAAGPAGPPGRAAGWRRAATFAATASFSCVKRSPTCLHPEVAIANSAHIASVLRRMSSLHRLKDAGAVQAAQHRRGAALGMRHHPHHVADGIGDAGDRVHRPVRVVAHV